MRASRGGNSPGGMGLKCPAGSSTASMCKPCRAAVRPVGNLQFAVRECPCSQNQLRLELVRSRDRCTSHCLPLMSPFVCVLLAPPAQVPLPPDTRCCHCHTCTTHRPSYLPLQSVSPGAKVFTLLPAIFHYEPTRAAPAATGPPASPLPVSPAVVPCPASLLSSLPARSRAVPWAQMNPGDKPLVSVPADVEWQLSTNGVALSGGVNLPVGS